MTTNRLVAVLILTGIAVGGMWACDGDKITGPEDLAGTYNLQTVDGQSLPYVIQQIGQDKEELTSGSVRLNSDQTYSGTLNVRYTVGGQVSTDVHTATGTWTHSGSAITFTNQFGTLTGSISGNTLTVIADGVTFVYRK